MRTKLRTVIVSLLIVQKLAAQIEGEFEQYHYLGSSGVSTVVPVIHLQGTDGWCMEARYNYETTGTVSCFGGKTFTPGRKGEWSITPLIGVSVGDLTACSSAIAFGLQRDRLFLSSDLEYCIDLNKRQNSLLFSWSELGYEISGPLFVGLSLQCTVQAGDAAIEPGLMAGFKLKRFSFPFYVFKPMRNGQYFVIGATYECAFRRRLQRI